MLTKTSFKTMTQIELLKWLEAHFLEKNHLNQYFEFNEGFSIKTNTS